MKKLFFLLSALSLTLSAVDLKITPRSPWKASGEKEYSIDFDGGKSWPTLLIKPGALRPNTYYKLTFEAKDSSDGLVNTQIGFKTSRDGKNTTRYFIWKGKTQYTPLTLYFKTPEKSADSELFSNINPGPAGKISVRNFALNELSAEDLKTNLLSAGDFEDGCNFNGFSSAYAKDLSIAPSPSFFCGEKSLKLTKKANDITDITSTDLPAIPGKTIEVKFWAKSAKNDVPARMILDFGFPGYKPHLYRQFLFKIEPEWKEFSFSCTVPADLKAYPALIEGMTKLRFGLLQSANAAEVYFDNIEYTLR